MPEKMGNGLRASLPQEGVSWGGKRTPAENFLATDNTPSAMQGRVRDGFLFHFIGVEGYSRTVSAPHPVFRVNSP